ncbi:MAG: BamA/TamA family outer membrane protein [Tannerella sp.]|jgi:outer membrane protein assembly factor BamA|nr:BamA/TamA family outer membrane protein [Tannerella sp.]
MKKETGNFQIFQSLAFQILALLCCLLSSCSVTSHIPKDERLYTGIKDINITDKDSIDIPDSLYMQLETALSVPPNNALFGSAKTRIPFPLGLWVYNATAGKKGKPNEWLYKWFGKKPVLVSTVNPEMRTRIAGNILRNNGYFSGEAFYSIIPGKKDSLTAKISYNITFNKPYIIDSIEYLRMQNRGDTLLKTKESERLIRKGDIFSIDRMEAERQRIAAIMRNNGYYYFRPEYIVYQADSSFEQQKVSLKVGLSQGIPRSLLKPWTIGNITIQLNGYDNELPTDSLLYRGIKIFYEGKLRVKPSTLYKKLFFKSGELYSLYRHTTAQDAFNRLNIFKYSEFQFIPEDTLRTTDTLDVRIISSLDYPLSASFNVNASFNDGNYAGPGLSLNLTQQNVFGRGETFTASILGSYEFYTGRFFKNNTGLINNFEVSVKGELVFPILFLPKFLRNDYDFTSATSINLNTNVLNRARYYQAISFGGDYSYDFIPNPIRHHVFTPIKLVFNKLLSTTPDFDAVTDKNRSLRQSLEDRFIPSIEYQYTLDNSSVRDESDKTWWRFEVSESGNLVSLYHTLSGKGFGEQKKIFNILYAQFVKAYTEWRYNIYIDRNRRLVMRIDGGVIYSYGNSTISPYNERFYTGGANSIRAFTVRSVGPGRFVPDPTNPYAYIDQNGDIKFEANIEYRSKLAGDLNLAVFLDAGNVWLLRPDETRQGGTFHWKHFPNDIALGVGLGFRYDMSMLVFRFDVGCALHYPYYTGKKGYFNTPSFTKGLGIHLALGYPF